MSEEHTEIRLARASDLAEILRMRTELLKEETALNEAVGGDMDGLDMMRYHVDVSKDLLDMVGFTLVAEKGGTLVGFVSFLPGKFVGHGGKSAKGVGFWVAPEERGSTTASRLWNEGLEVLKSTDAVQIITVEGNVLMADLAHRVGFAPVATIWEIAFSSVSERFMIAVPIP